MLDTETENKIIDEIKSTDGVKSSTVAFSLKLEKQLKEIRDFLSSRIDLWHDKINDLWYWRERQKEKKARLEAERQKREAEEKERKRKQKEAADIILKEFLQKNLYIAVSDWEIVKKQIIDVCPFYELAPNFVPLHNREFRESQKNEHKEYFDTLYTFPLDGQQREAIVTLGENVLVIAAAGSGKTATIVAKTHYLVEKMHVAPRNFVQMKERLHISHLPVMKMKRQNAQSSKDKLLVYRKTHAYTSFHDIATILVVSFPKSQIE